MATKTIKPKITKAAENPKVSIVENAEYKQLRNDYVRLQIQARLLARLVHAYTPSTKPAFTSKTRWEQIAYMNAIADQVLALESQMIDYEELKPKND